MASYQCVVLSQRPKDSIVPGETFKLERKPAPSESTLKDGEVLLESRYLSLDPAMRGWLNDTRSYIPPVKIGEVMRGQVIGVVKASKSQKFPTGSLATGTVGWTELAVVKDKHLEKVTLPKNGRLTDTLSVLGKSAHNEHPSL
jgi:NADPH-dependent curcumin reductase CurA